MNGNTQACWHKAELGGIGGGIVIEENRSNGRLSEFIGFWVVG